MSKAGLIIALVLAAVLSVVAYLVLKPGPTAPPSTPLIGSLDIGRVRTIEIIGSTGPRAILSVGGPGDAYWILESSTPAGKSLKWPAAATRVRAALRLLGALKTAPQAGAGPVAEPITRIVLGDEAGPRAQLSVSQTPLAGRTAVSAVDVPGIALGEEALAQVFAGDLSAWREPAVFPIDAAEASRIELTGGPAAVSMSRVGKSWAIVKPVPIPGDEPVITATLKALGSTAYLRFADGTDAGPAGFSAPAARIVIEIDRRVPSGDQALRTTLFQELIVGGPADVAGQTLLCRVTAWSVEIETGARANLWGPATGVIPRDALAAIATDAATYASRQASRIPSADVARLSIGSKTGDFNDAPAFQRDADGWRSSSTDPTTPEARAACGALLRLVTAERAQGASLTPPEGYTPEWSAQLTGSDGAILDTVEVGTCDAGASRTLSVRAGPRYLRYPTFPGAAALLWFSQHVNR